MIGRGRILAITALSFALAIPAGHDASAESRVSSRRDAPLLYDTVQLNAAVKALISDMRIEAVRSGVAWRTLDASLADIEPDPSILELLTVQPEHAVAPWDYIDRLVSEKRIADARARLEDHRALLDTIEGQMGVDRHIIVAIWGVESSFGAQPGTRSVIRSLATLAVVDRRRPAFWRKELLAALQILDRGDIGLPRMTGSWAGAMGHTQFMPSTFLTHAVDFDGDGRRDIWESLPDALASTANYLKNSGWQSGQAWGFEVIVPAGFDYRLAPPRDVRDLSAWQQLGVAPPAGNDWPGRLSQASLLLPTGMHGPTFLVGSNFQVLLQYNNSILYALAVGHLADRLTGMPPLSALWPIHDPPLDRPGRLELQELLAAEGHLDGAIDGIIGDGTRRAVRAWQAERGLPADGWPGRTLLENLRGVRSASQDF